MPLGGTRLFVLAGAIECAGMRGLTVGQKVLSGMPEDRRSGRNAVGNSQAALTRGRFLLGGVVLKIDDTIHHPCSPSVCALASPRCLLM